MRHERLLASDVSLLGRNAIRWTVVPGPTRTFALSLGNAGHVAVTGGPGGSWTAFVLDGREATTLGSSLTLDQATTLGAARACGEGDVPRRRRRALAPLPGDRASASLDPHVRLRA